MTDPQPFFRLQPLAQGALRIWFDVPDRPVNVLSEPVFEALVGVIDAMEASELPTWILLESAKPKGFCAGADLRRLAALGEASGIEAFLRCGQEAFDRLSRLASPTVAVIRGACLGGGLELALACRHRLAVDEPTTQIGMPESRLGLIPGWGGTQRLPRLIGEGAALRLLWSGDPVDARQAAAIGLVDSVATPDDLERDGFPSLLEKIVESRGGMRHLVEVPPEPKDRDFAGALPAGMATPARLAAEEAVRGGASDFESGLRIERRLFCELMATPETRSHLTGFLSARGRS